MINEEIPSADAYGIAAVQRARSESPEAFDETPSFTLPIPPFRHIYMAWGGI